MCVCLWRYALCTDVCGPWTTFVNQFSAAIMCVLGFQLKSAGLCGKHFDSLSHLTSQGCEFFKNCDKQFWPI